MPIDAQADEQRSLSYCTYIILSMVEDPQFGIGDATFQAAGGEEGIRALVDTFYDIMSSDLQYRTIRSWHPDDNCVSRDKLARFLCGWMGGPRRYTEKYGPISIPRVHAHLDVTEKERDDWLGCMAKALAKQAYPPSLIAYLLEQLAVPAEAVRAACTRNRQSPERVLKS